MHTVDKDQDIQLRVQALQMANCSGITASSTVATAKKYYEFLLNWPEAEKADGLLPIEETPK